MTAEEFKQAIDTFNQYLDRMHTAVTHICEDLEDSDYQELNLTMPAVVEGLGWIYEAASGFVGLGKIEAEQFSLLESLISNLGEAMENQDYLLLHDLMEFELIPLFDGLKIKDGEIN